MSETHRIDPLDQGCIVTADEAIMRVNSENAETCENLKGCKLPQPSPQVVSNIGVFDANRGPTPQSVAEIVEVKDVRPRERSETAVTSASDLGSTSSTSFNMPMTNEGQEAVPKGAKVEELVENIESAEAQDIPCANNDDGRKTFEMIKTKSYSEPTDYQKSANVLEEKTIRKTCSFTNIDIYLHEVILGDNPCAYGPSISLGWKRVGELSVPLDKYEESKPSKRSQKQMMLPRYVRERILMDHGVSRSEMNDAIEVSMTIKKQRQETIDKYYSKQKLRHMFSFLSIFKKKEKKNR